MTPKPFIAPEIDQLAPLFPGYEIQSLIATGGMGAVYCAVQKSLDRTVAIKILPREFSNDAAFCAGFEAEAKAMARLNHPNLIGVYDFGEVDGMLYIVMEFVPGKSIFHSAHGIAIDPMEVIRLVTGICNGLAHAHENGILHRDIKPSNILLDLNAQPKIGDFGLARPIETKIQEGEEIFGTPHYTAPEVVNSPQSVDFRADIFSVGVLLHELLTGRLPAEDQRPASVIARCDIRFDAIIRRATNPLPEMRYASASEISRDLHAIAASKSPMPARPAGPGAPPHPAPPKRKPVVTQEKSSSLPGVFMFLIAVVIAVYSFKLYQKNKSPRIVIIDDSTTNSSSAPQKEPATQEPAPGTTTATSTPPVEDSPANPEPEPGSSPTYQPDPLPAPDSTTEEPVPPKYDVAGFFTRAQNIMQDKAKPLIATRKENLVKNLADYERGIKRQIRKIEWRKLRDDTEVILKDYIKECEQDGNRIPKRISMDLSFVDGITSVHREALAKQEAIDEALVGSLSQLSATYILGLEKQIERLKKDNDPGAVSLIEEEIAKTRTDEDHFPDLMLQRAE